MSRALPLLDIATWRVDPQRFVSELRHACHHVGFFQLRHRVPSSLTERTTHAARRFFALSSAEKRAIDYAQSPAFRGYMSSGVENTAGVPDRREQLEVAAEGPTAPASAWPPYERLRGPNQWPAAQPELQETLGTYAEHMLGVSSELTQALCLALGLERSALDGYMSPEPHWQLKLAWYEPAASAESAASADAQPHVGVGAHTDSGFLTMLLQDGGGLQAFTQGEWTDVPPMGPDVVVCNLGEVAEVASGGYLLATPHRVLSPSAARLSIPFFYNPSLETVVDPLQLPASLAWERDGAYDATRHWRRPSNAMLREYGQNAFKSLARSHPAVFAAHHSDLKVLEDGQVVKRP